MFHIQWIWRSTDNRHRILFVVAMFFSAISSLMLLINPYLSALLIDRVIIAQDKEPLIPILMGMLAVQLVRLMLRFAMNMMLESTSQHTLYRLRCHLFSVLQYQENSFFNKYRTGDLMTRMTGDLEYCRHCISNISYQVVDSIVMFVSTLVFFLLLNWALTLLVLIAAPLLFLIMRKYSRLVRPKFVAIRERLSELNTAAQENIAGNRVVKAFAREDYERDRFNERNKAFKEANLDVNNTWLHYYPLIEGLANFMTLITIFAGAYFIIQGRLTPGELAIFTSLSWALANPLRNFGTLINDVQRFFSSAGKVTEIYYSRPLITDRANAVSHDKESIKGHVEFKNVSFSYNKEPVLDNVSFEVRPGETLAIMGPTGSGKTTLISLLVRLYDVSGGSVLLDGCDVRDWKLQELRAAVGNATQDVFLFSDTVEGNIAFGDLAMDEESVYDSARRAAAHEFIGRMPQGYDTIIGERGVGLSGGQKQRIALARALAVKPAVLVLDDTTSALDMETEMHIQQQLGQLPFPCTKIIIAQRISSVKNADLIIVLEHGQITECGTHSELLKKRGYYWETFALQSDTGDCKEVCAHGT
ncbi:MAG: ABC transporter ATP-binding protein [Oscillospiraceae bacterium]|nr:ABC transporter ATP-binding protein [Oscillospiraceae bacterium]MDD4412965.1 ABC transporter ATP-binding protein [Oscillospiraceae bacterium]